MGRPKNLNKNPVAESAIKELGLECLHLPPEGGPLSKVQLALATASLNARLRRDGLSAREMWTQRDQFTGQQLPIQDRHVIRQQQLTRSQSHQATALSKPRGRTAAPEHDLHVGDLVYLKGDCDKTRGRDKYLVVSINDIMCQLRKFTTSQFRSKTYDVRLSDCFPVVSTTLLQEHDPGPIRGLQDVDDCEGVTRSEPCTLPPTADMSSSICPGKSLRPALGQHPPIDTGSHDLTQLGQSEVCSPTPPVLLCQTPEVYHNARPDIGIPPDAPLPVGQTTPRKSTRCKRPPAWQVSGDWDVGL